MVKKENPDAMDLASPYYYALSTIAQCAAALAALIGLLGLWQLDRIQDERERLEQELRWLLHGICLKTEEMLILPVEELIGRAQAYVARDYSAMSEEALKIRALTWQELTSQKKVTEALQRWKALPGRRQLLMHALYRFLILALAIVVVAIVLLMFADWLSGRTWTGWALKGVIILMSIGLGGGSYSMVREAVRSTRTLVVLALLVALASSALAGPVRCTTYEEKSLGRL